MGYNNIEEVSIAIGSIEETVRLIRKALLPSVWSGKHITRENNPSTYRNVLIKEEIDGEYNFYVSVDTAPEGQESTWEWIQISSTSGTTSGGTKTHIVEIYGDLDDINNPQDGTLAIVRTENSLYFYNTKDNKNEWELLLGGVFSEQDYVVVDNITERDGIINPKHGMLVFVKGKSIEYRWNGNEWIISRYQISGKVSDEAKDYYVSWDGSDETGDGTVGSPWKTLTHTLLNIPSTMKHVQRIYLLSGISDSTYVFDEEINTIINLLTIQKGLRFYCETELVENSDVNFKTNKITKPNNPSALSLSTGVFDEENQYFGYLAGIGANNLRPIGKHGLNDIVFSGSMSGANDLSHGIYRFKSNIIIDELLPIGSDSGSANIIFYNCDVTLNRFRQNTRSKTIFQYSVVRVGNMLETTLSHIDFNHSILLSTNVNNPLLEITDKSPITINNLMMYVIDNNDKPILSNSAAIELNNGILELNSIVLDGFAFAIRTKGNSFVNHSYAKHTLIANDVGALVQICGSGLNWNMGSSDVGKTVEPHSQKLYINGVCYLFSLDSGNNTILKNININFNDGYLSGEILKNPFVTENDGEWKNVNDLIKNRLTPKPKNLIDIERNVSIVFPNSFGNIENMDYVVDWGIGGDEILIGNTTINKSIKIDYTATTDDDIEIGSVYLTNKEDINIETGEYSIYRETVFDDIGLVFKKEIDGNNINLIIENTRDDEEPITLEMDIRRYQI